VSVAAGFGGHAGRRSTGPDVAAAAVVPVEVAVRSAILLAAGQFSDGGHGGEVGFSERSIAPNSVKQTRNVPSENALEIVRCNV